MRNNLNFYVPTIAKKILKQSLIQALLFIFVIVLDLWTKTSTETWLGYRGIYEVIPNFFWIHVLRNTGGAWSLFSGSDWLFKSLPLIASVLMLVYYFRTQEKQTLLRFALVFLLAGTLGNYIDRLSLGYVRDFLSFNTFGYMFPVFNVADISLNVGVGLLILDTLLEGKKHDRK